MIYQELYSGLTPIAKGRPRFTKSGRTYTPARTALYERQIRNGYNGPVFRGAVDLSCTFGMKIPQSESKKNRELILRGEIRPCRRPDLDNLCKAVQDALNGVAYEDDAQIVGLSAVKVYSDVPYVQIKINGEQ